jgi:hypothetical protein
MPYTRKDADEAISHAHSNMSQSSLILAEAQLHALATISEQLGELNRALGKRGALGELVTQLQSLTTSRSRRTGNE